MTTKYRCCRHNISGGAQARGIQSDSPVEISYYLIYTIPFELLANQYDIFKDQSRLA
jgi:hypothetical protein